MVATNGQAVGLAIVSILTIGAGIGAMVVYRVAVEQEVLLLGFWPYALSVFLGGVFGLVAAGVRNDFSAGLYLGFCILGLAIVGSFAIINGLLFFPFTRQGETAGTLIATSFGLIVVSWVLILIGSAISCGTCCCGKTKRPPKNQALARTSSYMDTGPARAPDNPAYLQDAYMHQTSYGRYPWNVGR